MGVNLNFNAAEVEPNKALDPLPPDWYAVQIVKSEAKPTKDSTPQMPAGYLELTLEVVFGPHKGRKLFDRLNLQNANAQTVDIAKGTLSAICRSVNVIQMTNTEQLHGKPLLAKVVVKPAQGQYGPSNEIKGYKAMEGEGGGMNMAGAAGPGVPSWANGNNAAAPAAPAAGVSSPGQQTVPAATAPASNPAPATGGFSFGMGGGGAATPGPAAPTGGETPDWAKPAQ